MSLLTIRAEQALIGAMLAGQKLPPEIEHQLADSFGHYKLRDLYTTVLDLRDHHHGDDLLRAVADRADEAGVDTQWLVQLRDSCPSATHIATYARMVQVAGFRRTMTEHSHRITTTQTTGPGTVSGMALALQRQTDAHQAFTSIDDQRALTIWQAPTHEDQSARTGGTRAETEDLVLAGLLAYPYEAKHVSEFVEPETFTSGQRREIFTTIISLAANDGPVDELIVLWETERHRATNDLHGTDERETYLDSEEITEANAIYLHHLATETVASGTAIRIGHQLVLADIRGEIAHNAALAAQREAELRIPTEGPQQTAVALDPSLIAPPPVDTGQQPTIER